MERKWPYALLFNRALCSLFLDYFSKDNKIKLSEELQYILVEVGRYQGRCKLFDMTHSIYLSQMGCSMGLAELARNGLIEVIEDHGEKVIRYSSQGVSYFDVYSNNMKNLEEEVYRVLGKDDVNKLISYSRRFYESMAKGDAEMAKIPEHWRMLTHYTVMIEKKLEFVLRRVAELNTITYFQRMILVDLTFFETHSRQEIAKQLNISLEKLDKECEYLFKRNFITLKNDDLSLTEDGQNKASGILVYLFHIEQMGMIALKEEEQREYITLLARAIEATSSYATTNHRFDYSGLQIK